MSTTTAADLDNMTPQELRTKLAEYGLPVMPITASTRGLMAKKLKVAMDARHKDSRKTLAKYSSGDDSDLDINTTTISNKKKRHTINSMLPPPPTTTITKTRKTPRKSEVPPPTTTTTSTSITNNTRGSIAVDKDKDSDRESDSEKSYKVLETITTKKVSRHYVKPKDYDTGSDSEVDSILNKSKRTTRTSPTSTSSAPKVPARQTTIGGSYSSPYSSADNLNSIRSRLGLSQNFDRNDSIARNESLSSSYLSTVKSAENGDEISSPYLSNFARKLSTLKADQSVNNDGVGTNGGGVYRKYYESAYRKRGDVSGDFRSAGEKNILKNNLVSFTIVGLVIAFFVGVSFMYVGMKTEDTPEVPICIENTKTSRPSFNCVKDADVGNVLNLLKMLEPELKSRAVNNKCGLDVVPHMTASDVVAFVTDKHPDEASERIIYNLYNLHVVLLQNRKSTPISIVDFSQEPHVALSSREDIVKFREQSKAGLEVLNPSISWTCLLYHKLYSNVWLLLTLASVGILIYSIYRLVKLYSAYRKNKADQVYSMVEQIIDVISQESTDSPSASGKSLPVSHVRDMLIAPQSRDKMSAIWEEAIKFLEKNESRVRFEVDRIAGEEYKTFRWVSPKGSPRTRGTGARAWQGQAFETQKGSVNNLTISPTECLKIRHMVDKNDKNPNLKAVVQDAILEKCGPKCKILHIEIDKVSCCVYVKCATSDDAGIVYQSLHGWWYEGNLITVKYLRLERYMDHFPQSPSSGPPYLKLSSQ